MPVAIGKALNLDTVAYNIPVGLPCGYVTGFARQKK